MLVDCLCFFLSSIMNIELRQLLFVYFRDNAVRAIELLMKKQGKFDYILLETTGLADPGKIH